jgi:hypothetical protein
MNGKSGIGDGERRHAAEEWAERELQGHPSRLTALGAWAFKTAFG